MSSLEADGATNTEANASGRKSTSCRHHRRSKQRSRLPSMAASSETTTDASIRFSDSDSDQSWHSICEPHCREKRKRPCLDSDNEEIDLEIGELELQSRKDERDCRICHLSLSISGGISGGEQVQEEESIGMAIELGCSCKGDLAAAHKHCAETWFQTKGNTICEICGANALNVTGVQANEADTNTVASVAAPSVAPETQGFRHGRHVMNFLLACLIFAFAITWFFHFDILP